MATQSAKLSPTRSNSANLRWLRNAMGAIGVSTKSVLREYSPNVSDAFSSGASALRNIGKSASGTKADQIIRNNKYVQYANKAFRNAIDDIKSGNLAGVQDRSTKAMGMDFDSMFNDDSSSGGLTFGDEGGSDINIAYVDASGNDAGFADLASSMNRNTELTLKTGKAQMDAYIAISSASLQQNAQISEQIIQHLAGIQNNLAALVEYNNTNMNKFIEASMAYYENTGAAMKESEAASSSVSASDVLKSGGSINFSNYKQYIKNQLKKNLSGSELGPIVSMIDDQALEFFAANPLGMVTDGLVKLIMPKIFTTAIKGFEQTFSSMLPNMLHRLNEWGKKQTGSMANRMIGTLAKSFGIGVDDKINELDHSQIKIERGPVPFDGETKNAITNIITKELREQTVYLKHIAGHFGLKGKKATDALQSGTFFDYEDNRFITIKDLDNKILKSITDAIENGFSSTDFNKVMRRSIDRSGGNKDDLNSLLTQFYTSLDSSGKVVRFDNGKVPEYLKKNIKNFTGSDDAKKAFIRLLEDIVATNPLVGMTLSQGTIAARASRNKAIDDILNNPSTSGILHTSTFDGDHNLDELMRRYLSEEASKIINAKDAKGKKIKYGPYQTVDTRDVMKRYDINVEAMELLDRFKNRTKRGVKDVTSAIASGDTNASLAAIGNVFKDGSVEVFKMLNENFFAPLKKSLFGEKDDAGFSRGGFFSSAKNTIKDMTLETAHQLTGKEYVDSEGKRHEKIENSVFGTIKEAIHEKFFGKLTTDEDGNTKGLLTSITDNIKESFVGWHHAMFGELDANGEEVTTENVTKKMKEYLKGKLPKAMLGGIGGGVFGLASGGLLGTLLGGPIGGVAMGAAVGLASDSAKFRKWLFGDKDLDNGFISKKTQEYVKKNKNPLIAGAVLGGAKGLLGGGGILGTLVGGPIAGALLGVATATTVRSKTFHDFLFGDEEGYHKGIVNSFKDAFKSTKEANKDAAGLSLSGKAAGMMLTGAGAGALTAAVVSKMGLLGSMLTPFGPIGGAMIGLGLSIRAQSDTFKKWLFGNGKDKSDDDYQLGVIGQFTNMLQVHILRPFRRVVTDLAEDAALTIKHDVLGVVEKAFEPLSMGIAKVVKGFIGKGKGLLNFVGRQAVDKLVSPIVKVANAAIITPFTKLATGVAKLTYGVAKGIATVPFKIVNKLVDFMTSPIRKFFSKAFHPIKTVKWLAGKFNDLLDKHLGISLSPLGSFIKRALKKGIGGGIRKAARATKAVVTTPFRTVGFLGDVAGGVGDYLAGKRVQNKGKDVAEAELREIYERTITPFKNNNVGDDSADIPDFDTWKREYLLSNPKLRNKYRKDFKKADKAQARLNRRDRKQREENEKILARASGYSRIDDTEENRAWLQKKDPKAFKKLRGDAIDAGMLKDTAKMSDEQLGKADTSKMTNDVRKVALLQQILNVLRGKNPDGSDKKESRRIKGRLFKNINLGSEGDADETPIDDADTTSSDEDKKVDMSSFGSIHKFMMDHGVSAEELEGLNVSELTNLFLSKGFKITDLMGAGLNRAKESFKDSGMFSTILNMFSGKGYDNGTNNTEEGIHVVGETAPELVMTGRGQKVLSGKNRALNVNLSDISDKVKRFIKQTVQDGSSGSGESANPLYKLTQRRLVPNLKNPLGTAIDRINDQKENEEEKEERQQKLKSKIEDAKLRAEDLAVTASERQAEIKSEEEATKRSTVYDAIISMSHGIKRQEKGDNAFHKLWSSIFSKKGLITAGLIALGGVILKFLSNNDGIFGTLKTVLSNVGDVVGYIYDRIFGDGSSHTENGESTDGKGAAEEAEEGLTDAKELAQGDIEGYLENDEGNIDHRSGSKANLLLNLSRKPMRMASAVYGFVKNRITNKTFARPKGGYTKFGFREMRKDGKNLMKKSLERWGTKNVAEEATEDAAQSVVEEVVEKSLRKGAENTAETVTEDAVQKAASEAVEKVTKETAEGATEKVVEKAVKETAESAVEDVATKNSKILNIAITKVTTFFDDLIKYVSKKAGQKLSGTLLESLLTKVTSVLTKHIGKIANKLLAILGLNVGLATTTVGYLASNAVFMTIGAINGVSGTARLFRIDKEDVDHPFMDIIAGAFGAVTSSTLGAFLDVINELLVAVAGIDMFNIAACAIYRGINNLIGKDDKVKKLDTAQDEFHEGYLDYQEEEISDQFKILKATGIAPKDEEGNFISEDAYIAGVRDGKYGASYDSFADYNDKKNKTIGGRILQVGHDLLEVGGAAVKGIAGGLVGTKSTYYEDENGNRYYENDDGRLRVETKDGLRLGYVSDSEDIKANLSDAKVEETDGLLSGAIRGFKKIVNKNKEKKEKEKKDAEKDTLECLSTQTNMVYVERNANVYYAPTGNGTYTRYETGGVPISEEGAYTAEDIRRMISDKDVYAVSKTNFDNSFADRDAKIENLQTNVNGMFDLGLNSSEEFINAKVQDIEDSEVAKTRSIKPGSKVNTSGTKVYFTPHGTFFKRSGSKWKEYNLNGDYLGSSHDITEEEFDEMLSLSYLKEGTFKSNKTAENSIRKTFTLSNSSWKSATSLFSSTINMVKDFFGGSNSSSSSSSSSSSISFNTSSSSSSSSSSNSYDGYLPSTSMAYNSIGFGGSGEGHPRGGGFGNSNVQPDTMNGFPYYAQNDKRWASTSYDFNGDGATMGDSGCGPSVMSMVLSKVTGKNISPVTLANFAQETGTRDDTGTNWNFIGNTARAAGLNVDQQYNPNSRYIEDSVDAGNPVVLSGYSNGANTPYTSAGHYIVAVGRDSNGNIKVNDPRGKAFSRSYKPEELSKYTGSAWSIGKSGGLGRRKYRRGGGRSGNDVMSKIGGFFSELGTRTVNGLLTGTFDSNWNSYWNPTTTTTTTTGTTGSAVVGGSTNLTGNSTTEQIWNYLTGQLGITKEGAAGLMGNMEKESGLIPNNLEDLYQIRYGLTDEGYTASVDNGSYTRDQFINDQFGYGLVQWTKPAERKAGLYDTARQMGVSVGNIAAQLSWLMQELQGNYKGVYDILRTTTDVRQASNAVLHDFESPKYASSKENERYQASMKYYNQFAGSGSGKGNRLRLLNKRRGGRGTPAGDARIAVVGWMLAIMGQNTYSQKSHLRGRVGDGLNGHGYGDCSSTVAWCYKQGTGLSIGATTRDEWQTGTIIQQNTTDGAVPDESKMLPGDLIFFWRPGCSKSDPAQQMSHVEMYIGSSTIAGHGGGTGPTTKNLQNYCAGWDGAYCYVVRYITDENVASLSVQGPDPSLYKVSNTFVDENGMSSNGANVAASSAVGSSTSTGATASTSNSVLDKIGGFFSELGTRTMNGLLTGTFDNDWNSYWSGVTTVESSTDTPTDVVSTGGSNGSSYPLYNLDDKTKEFVAGVVAGETGGADSVAARQEASQMANLNEVHFKKQPNAESIKATLTSGWYASRSLRQSATDVTRDAVETVMNNGRRTLPRYVTEHDMFPGDIKNAKDRSEYKVGDDVANIYGSKYKFYTFFGRDKKGDIAGYFPKDYEKYQSDVPWGGGAGTGAKLRRRKTIRPIFGGHGEGDKNYISKASTGTYTTNMPKRLSGVGTETSLKTGIETSFNNSLMSILQNANQAKSSGNNAALLNCIVELLGLIAENTGMSASSIQRANQLLSELRGMRQSSTTKTPTSNAGGNQMNKLPETMKKNSTGSSKNMKLAQRIAAGK